MNQRQVKPEFVLPSLRFCLLVLFVLLAQLIPPANAQGSCQAKKSGTAATQQPSTIEAEPSPDNDWMDKHKKLVKLAKTSHPDIVFFGDSITEGMNVDLLHKIISPQAMNFGISGDRTQHLLWRLRNGELGFARPEPKLFAVLIGTNNLSVIPGYPVATNEEICLGVQAVINELKEHFPASKILVISILPRDEKPDTNTRKRVNATNNLIKRLSDNKHVWYADIGNALLEPDGKISPSIMSDFLHPTQKLGQQRMFTAIKPRLDEMLDKGKPAK